MIIKLAVHWQTQSELLGGETL